jgi:preprotein translocase subunit SecG
LLVLVQRGRGGGLTGALGGMGGQSAFGAKAGDTFTRVTMVTATLWILICMAAIKFLGTDDKFGADRGRGVEIDMPLPGLGGGEDQDEAAGAGLGGILDEVLDDVPATPGAGAGAGALDGGDSSPPED